MTRSTCRADHQGQLAAIQNPVVVDPREFVLILAPMRRAGTRLEAWMAPGAWAIRFIG